jgi:probable phosphoglycerate mutase
VFQSLYLIRHGETEWSGEGNIALFTHGHFGCALAARWIELAVIEGQHFLLSTASISILGSHPTHPEVPVISLWNASAESAMA